MNQYSISSKQLRILISGIAIGVICLILTWIGDNELHSRFWSNLLHNSVFFTGIALMAGFFMCACITAWAGWHTVFKRVWEAFSLFLIVGLGLMLILAIGNYFGWHHLYHWTDASAVRNDELLQHKSGFLSNNWYLLATVLFISLWLFIIWRIRVLSLAEDDHRTNRFTQHHKIRTWAAIFLPVAGFSSAAVIWLWIMSVDAHWYSTLFAWYCAASWFVAMICLTILVLIYLKSQGYYEQVSRDHIHDLGKFLFAFSIFWTYLWFSQYMLIWYGNIGEETVYYQTRFREYPVLFYGNLILNFVLPLLILLPNYTKRKFGIIGFVAGLVLFGHWWDYFQMIKPGVAHTTAELLGGAGHGHGAGAHASHFAMGFNVPGLLEIGIFTGFLCVFLLFVYKVLEKAALVPKNDPYLAESLHHHV